jgi:DNA-binding MarR family transcriptional regulator
MIQPFNADFLTPTKKFRRLSVLLAVHGSPRISQHKMAQMIHLSSSMVNNYLKELQDQGLILMSGQTNRTQSYHLTSSGRNELMSLLLAYSAEIIQLYSAAKREVTARLNRLCSEQVHSIALFGAAETAEVVYAALKGTPLKVKAILDSDPRKQGRPFNDLTIESPDRLKGLDVDAVVITSYARQKEIHHCIHQIVGEDIRVKKLSDL